MSRLVRFAFLVVLVAASFTLPAAGEVALQLDATVETTDDGEATVAITLTNEGDETSVAPVVSIDTTVTSQTSENATYRDSTREWLWLTVEPGETVRVTATVPVQDDSVEITVADADENTASTTVEPGETVRATTTAPVRDDSVETTVADADGNTESTAVETTVADADGNTAFTTLTPDGGVSLFVVAAVVGVLLVVAGGVVVWYRRR